MSDVLEVSVPAESVVTEEVIVAAVRNEYDGTFTLGDRTFPIRDLGYDDYIEFARLARPMIESVTRGFDLLSGDFDVTLLDMGSMIEAAGKELPKLVVLCCRQSDKAVTVDQVKALAVISKPGAPPAALLDVVLLQIKHNQMIGELARFFPVVMKRLHDLVPSTTEETPSSS